MHDSAAIRTAIRQQRNRLEVHQAQTSAAALFGRVIGHPWFVNSRRLAAYLPVGGEIDVTPLVEHAWSMHKEVYLPVLAPFGAARLWFARYEAGCRLHCNRFGILEPALRDNKVLPAYALSLVLTPLVAFDEQCHRLGMGGGYYDRTFAFLRRRRHWCRPRLLGMAYEFQKTAAIQVRYWDVDLDAVATDHAWYAAKASQR